MMDVDALFLEDQLERMRRLTEHMSQVHSRVVENSCHISGDRDHLHSPLSEVSDRFLGSNPLSNE